MFVILTETICSCTGTRRIIKCWKLTNGASNLQAAQNAIKHELVFQFRTCHQDSQRHTWNIFVGTLHSMNQPINCSFLCITLFRDAVNELYVFALIDTKVHRKSAVFKTWSWRRAGSSAPTCLPSSTAAASVPRVSPPAAPSSAVARPTPCSDHVPRPTWLPTNSAVSTQLSVGPRSRCTTAPARLIPPLWAPLTTRRLSGTLLGSTRCSGRVRLIYGDSGTSIRPVLPMRCKDFRTIGELSDWKRCFESAAMSNRISGMTGVLVLFLAGIIRWLA